MLALSGCASTRIPADWPTFGQSETNGECISLAGQYSNIPADRAYREPSAFRKVGGKGAHDYRLSQILESLTLVLPSDHELIMHIDIQLVGANRVIISGSHQNNESVGISTTLLQAGKVSANPDDAEFSYFTCKNGFVHISLTSWMPITPYAAAGFFNFRYIRMRKAVDGSLIVNASSDMHVTLPLIPVPITGSTEGFDTWYRFEPYTTQSGENIRFPKQQ
jgi:hypothetical protein